MSYLVAVAHPEPSTAVCTRE
uniref:Uncharacterized protein n=1 Tax=Anguilla anguilla TaxID=7936 RepID=A0A0E9VQB7_ANGAN